MSSTLPLTSKLSACRPWIADALGLTCLYALAILFVASAWGTWPDPLIDAGHQFYSFWRVSQGALLYRDVAYYYGPMSAHYNALLFYLFGPSIQTLVLSNLLAYTAILTLLYFVVRRAWGRLAAVTAGAVFISVFSFSQLVGIHNYTYALPYSQESTHGMLVILALLLLSCRWLERPSSLLAFAIGLCGGIAFVLKPEYILAAGVLSTCVLVLRYVKRLPLRLREWFWLLAGVVLPTLAFTGWFSLRLSWSDAFIYASKAWWLVLVDKIQSEETIIFSGFMGLDQPLPNLVSHLIAMLFGAGILAALWGIGRLAENSWPARLRYIAAGLLTLVLAVATLSLGATGPVLGLTPLIPGYLLFRAWRQLAQTGQLAPDTTASLLLALAAMLMLVRMILNVRVDQFGFVQTALAGVLVAAFMTGGIPQWTRTPAGRNACIASALVILLLWCLPIVQASQRRLSKHTEAVAEGGDRFYAEGVRGRIVNAVYERLSVLPEGNLLVIPEGIMMNYLTRRPGALAVQSLMPGALRNGREDQVLAQLTQGPPRYLLVISRDLSEYGVDRFGAHGGLGSKILGWVSANYKLDTHWGGDPLDPKQMGAMLLLYSGTGKPTPSTTSAPASGQ